MKIINTADSQGHIPVYMLLYGSGGIGKSTFATTAPGAFLADCENGSKYFGLRGIRLPVALIETWTDFAGTGGFVDMAIANPKVQTIIVDPIGELMDKCKRGLTGSGLIDPGGNPTLKGWGELSNRMRTQLKRLRDSGKNVILIAHVEKVMDEGRVLFQPKIQTKLSEDIINMVDIVAFMEAKRQEDGTVERYITVDPTHSGGKVAAKDRTGQLPAIMPPDFKAIQEAIGQAEAEAGSAEDPQAEDLETPPAAAEAPAESPEETDRQAKLDAAKSKLQAATANEPANQ